MKKILIFIIVLVAFGNLMNAQQQNDSTAIQKVESPVIVVKLPESESYKWKNYSLTFSKMVSDSRCPREVSCVWAGNAEVSMSLKIDDNLIDSKEIVLPNPEQNGTSFKLAEKSFRVYGLSPYPTTKMKEKGNIDYYLRVEIPTE
jgi:hypothetical protein